MCELPVALGFGVVSGTIVMSEFDMSAMPRVPVLPDFALSSDLSVIPAGLVAPAGWAIPALANRASIPCTEHKGTDGNDLIPLLGTTNDNMVAVMK